MLEKLLYNPNQVYSFGTICQNIVFAFILGMFIAYIYHRTHIGISYSKSFVQTLVQLCMLTAVVMMVIGNNIARAFGLVGALSVIRFRTAVKDARDTAYVFFALVIGMAIGTGFYDIALIASMGLLGAIGFLHFTNFGGRFRKYLTLRFRVAPGLYDKDKFAALIDKFSAKKSMQSTSTKQGGTEIEVIYKIRLKNVGQQTELVEELRKIAGIIKVEILNIEEEY